MYNERNEGFSIREVILKVLFFALFIIILVLLFPTRCSLNTNDVDKIFNENIKTMKDAGISYFTLQRMPTLEGESKELTLGEMLEQKLLLEFKDSNNNSCSLTESYVKVTKDKEEYVMRINLKCTDKEDYIIVHLGCYDYCEGLLCEKIDEDAESSKPTTGGNGENIGGTNPDTPTQEVVYRYKYIKKIAAKYSDWSNWSEWSTTAKTANNTTEVKTNVVETKNQIKTLLGYKNVTVEDKTKPIYEEKEVEIGSEKVATSCKEFGEKKTTVPTGNYTYKYSDWKVSRDNVEFATVPKDTETVKYVYDYAANTSCGDCASRMVTVYDIYTRTKTKVTEYKTVTEAYCKEYNYETVTQTGKVKVLIGYEKKTTREPIYGYTTQIVKTTYYSFRTRTLTPGYDLYEWSRSANDKTLTDKGYSYTGIKEKIS